MSHEIRTPMNAILGFISILKEKEKEEKKLKYFNIVQTSGDNLLMIINDILDFSKIESDKIELDYIMVNPYEEFINITNQFTQNDNKKNLIFEIKIAEELSNPMSMDVIKVTQILNNILSNAIKFSHVGATVKVDILYKRTEQKVFVSVENEGVEIAQDKQALIFEPFTQEDNSTTRKYGGTGLGLTISKKLIELMNGKLSLDASKKDGARFYFDIDVKEKKNTIKHESIISIIEPCEAITKEIQSTKKKETYIMIVEDNPTNQIFMEALMDSMSINYKIANNGFESIELYKTDKFDLILMDENMPVMSGSEATIKIRELEEKNGTHTPIIALTANALGGDKEKFLNIGMDDYLSKPLAKKDLENILIKYIK
jgi:CheY-like chemotaxis protein